MFKNVASQKAIYFAFDSTTNLPKTGDAANITAYVSKDYGAVTVLGDTSATEMDATNAKGYYLFDLTQTETNADTLLFSAKSSTANIVVIGVPATVFTAPTTGFLAPATSGRTLVVDAAGLADANVVKLGPTGSGTAQTARDIGASVLLSTGTGTGQLDFTSGVVKANVTQLLGTAWLAPGTAGTPDVNVKLWNALTTVALPLVPTVAGRTLDVSAGGEAGVDWANVGTPGSTVNLSATTLNLVNTVTTVTNQLTAAAIASGVWQDATAGDFTVASSIGKSLYTSGVVPGGSGGLFISGSNSGTTTFGALTVTGATTLTGAVTASNAGNNFVGIDVAKAAGTAWNSGAIGASTFAAGAIDAAAIAADAIGSSELAASAVAEIATGIWTDLLAGSDFSTAASIGKLLKDDIDAAVSSRMATFTLPTNFSALGINASGHISRVVLVDTLTTYTGNTPQTGDNFARIGAPVGASLSADLAAVQADLPQRVTKNVALSAFMFFMVDSADHISGKTSLTVTATRSLDGAAFGACANAVAEVSNGWYKIDLAAADLNATVVALKMTAAGADSRNLTIVTEPT